VAGIVDLMKKGLRLSCLTTILASFLPESST